MPFARPTVALAVLSFLSAAPAAAVHDVERRVGDPCAGRALRGAGPLPRLEERGLAAPLPSLGARTKGGAGRRPARSRGGRGGSRPPQGAGRPRRRPLGARGFGDPPARGPDQFSSGGQGVKTRSTGLSRERPGREGPRGRSRRQGAPGATSWRSCPRNGRASPSPWAGGSSSRATTDCPSWAGSMRSGRAAWSFWTSPPGGPRPWPIWGFCRAPGRGRPTRMRSSPSTIGRWRRLRTTLGELRELHRNQNGSADLPEQIHRGQQPFHGECASGADVSRRLRVLGALLRDEEGLEPSDPRRAPGGQRGRRVLHAAV